MSASWGPGPELPPDIPPARLCCGQRHYDAVCPDGKVMCCICFSRFPVDELHTDPADGKKADVCQDCVAKEAERRPS